MKMIYKIIKIIIIIEEILIYQEDNKINKIKIKINNIKSLLKNNKKKKECLLNKLDKLQSNLIKQNLKLKVSFEINNIQF
jgi:hypothetical protein